MAQVGDTVRYLNSTGGGKITRIEGKVAYVEEDGFETPVLLKEVVVVLPAGHEPEVKGARLMFDQKAYDNGKSENRKSPVKESAKEEKNEGFDPRKAAMGAVIEVEQEKPELTGYGDRISLALAFEPDDVKKLSDTEFTAVLVNDSNYTLYFSFLRRAAEERKWTTVFSGEVAPNELIDLARLNHLQLGNYEKVAIQAVAFRKDAPFELKTPINIEKKLDLTKFHKFHCFRPGLYFETPVIEIQLINKDEVKVEKEPDYSALSKALDTHGSVKPKKEYRRQRKAPADDSLNPHKLLPPIEVDLHIAELVDSIAGMDNSAMLELQLKTVREVMQKNRQRIGQKIIFIHGKGEGVLRKAVLSLLKKEYPSCTTQDASFQEYGFGATLVTIRH